jgi:hypothetical protein
MRTAGEAIKAAELDTPAGWERRNVFFIGTREQLGDRSGAGPHRYEKT